MSCPDAFKKNSIVASDSWIRWRCKLSDKNERSVVRIKRYKVQDKRFKGKGWMLWIISPLKIKAKAHVPSSAQ